MVKYKEREYLMTTANSQEKILTIVVPVYNTEEYLPKCINSVLNCANIQDIELLIINDGSPDNSDAVLSQYAQDYPHVVRYIRKENGGWGSCINLAITEAKGKYFKILDSDDYYATDALDLFIGYIRHSSVDLVISAMTEHYNEGYIVDTDIPTMRSGITIDARDHFASIGHNYPMGMTCYRTSVLRDHQIRISVRYYSDIEFNLKPLPFVHNVLYVPCNVYQYLKTRQESSTASRGYAINKNNYMVVVENIIKHFCSYKNIMGEELSKLYKNEMLSLSRSVYIFYLSPLYRLKNIPCNILELEEFTCFLSEYSPETLKKLHQLRKFFIPYIWIWNKFRINFLYLKKLWM